VKERLLYTKLVRPPLRFFSAQTHSCPICLAFSGKTDCVKYLLDKGAVIDAIDSLEGTSLHNAAFQGHTDTCQVLLQKGANINKTDDHKATALHLAAMNGQNDTIKLLLDNAAQVDLQDDDGTPRGCYLCWTDLMFGLLQKGCTPLMHAVPFLPCVQQLLARGSKVNLVDASGRTALFYSVAKHHEATAKVSITFPRYGITN